MKKFLYVMMAVLMSAAMNGQTATLTSSASSYAAAGGNVTLTATITYTGLTPNALGFTINIPTGWALVSTQGTNVPSAVPDPGTTDSLEYAYTSFPAGSATFTATVSYPAGMSTNQVITASAIYRSPLQNLTVASLTLTPTPTPPSFLPANGGQQPVNLSVPAGQSANFLAMATGVPAPTYQWRKGGVNIPGATLATYTIATVSSTDAGSYDVVATNSGGTATSTAATLTVTKALQTITFGALPTKVFGDAAFALTATASSGLPVSYTSSNLGVATVSGSTVTIVGGGTATITATQAGNADYQAAADVAQTLTVGKANATVTLGSLAATYNGSAKAATATTSPAGLPVVFTYDGGAAAPTNVGSYAVVGTINSNNYTGSASGTLVIGKGDQTITFGALTAKSFSDGTLTLGATASSGLAVSYTSSNPAVATVSGNVVTFVGVGTTNLTASQAGNPNYNAAADVMQPLTINQAAQTITFGAVPAKVFGDANFNLGATASSGLAVSYTSSNPAVATVSGNTVTVVAVGETDLVASQAGNANYLAATPVTQKLTVSKAPATVTLAGLTPTYDGNAKVVTATTSPAGLNVTFTYAGSAIAPTNAGTYAVVGTIDDPRYQGTASGSLVIAKAAQTITFGALATKTFGDTPFALTATSSATLPVTYASGTPAVATVAGDTVTILTGGTTVITASQPGDANFLPAANVTQTLTVNKAAATVTIDAASLAQTYNGSARVVLATTTPAGLTVGFTYGGSATAPTGAGTYAVVGTINDPRYTGSATDTLIVAKAAQTITFEQPPTKSVDSAPFTLVGSATSTLPLTYTTSNPSAGTVATVSNGTVTLVSPGTITITAAQAGNDNYLPATPVDRTLTVLNQSQVITFAGAQLAGKTFGDAPFAIQASSNRNLLVTFASSNPGVVTVGASSLTGGNSTATVTIVGAGTATITASQVGDSNTAQAADVVNPITIAQKATTVTLGSLAATYDGTPKAASATTVPAGLNVVFAYGAAPGSPVPPTNAGTTAVTATIVDANYTGTATGNLVIAKANQTITFPTQAPKVVNAPAFNPGATASSGLPVTYTSSNTTVATVSGNQVTVAALGTTTLTAKQAGDSNYNAAPDVPQTLTVNPVAPQIVGAPATVPTAIRGSAFTYGPITLNALSAPVIFSATGLPNGLSVNPATGDITGVPTAEGTFNVILSATNATAVATKAIAIVVQPPAPTITSPAAASATAGTAFSYTLAATPATGVTFTATNVPAWLTFTPATGVLAGTPTVAGVTTVTLTATNATGAASLPLVITTTLPANAPAYVGPTNPSGTAGVAFSFTPNFGTGTTNYALTAGTLPTGLSFNGSTGAITGTTQLAGTYPITVSATRGGLTATATLNLTINPAASAPVVSVTGGNVRSATVGVAFGPIALTATPAATSFTIGSLPAGLTVGGTATAPTIGGTPSAAPGTYNVTISASNTAGSGPSTTLVITLNPNPQAPLITSAPAVQGRVGVAIDYSFSAMPALTTTYATSSAAVLASLGLTLDGTAGKITGTPPAGSTGSYTVYVAGTNANGLGLALALTINIAPPLTVPVINSNGTAGGQVGRAFNYQITATNAPTSFNATALPAGLTVDTTTGLISGVPTTATTTAAEVTLTATNADGTSNPKTLSINIAAAAATPVITSAATATGRVGLAFAYKISASEAPTSYVATELPAGLTVNPTTGDITGSPTQAGTFTASLRAANAAGLGAASSLTFTIAAAPSAPAITSAASASGTVGTAFNYQTLASPGTITSYAYTGTLPAGLSFNSASGAISGSPTQPGAFSISLTATSDAGTSSPQSLALNINPAANVPVITSAGTASGNVGTTFSYQITATNTPHVTLDAANLPAGLNVNPYTGLIQGSPTAVGTTTASLVGTNANGTGPARDLTITIQPSTSAPVVSGASQVSAQVGVAFTYQITASGGPTSYEVVGAPAWMSINTATGAISGSPTAPGSLTVFLLATNSAGTSAPKLFTITIAPAANTPVITSSRTLEGTAGQAFPTYTLSATPAATSYVVSGLPPGLTLSGNTISGTPTASIPVPYAVTVSGVNANGIGAPVIVNITIKPSITFGN